MSGYFQRLIARSSGSGVRIRPRSLHPWAMRPEAVETFHGESLPTLPAPTTAPPSMTGAPASSTGDLPTEAAAEALPRTPGMGQSMPAALRPAVVPRRESPESREAPEPAQPLRFDTGPNHAEDDFRLVISPYAPELPGHGDEPLPVSSPIRLTGEQRVQVRAANQRSATPGLYRPSPSEEAAEIHVRIGRIEVTAVQAPAAAKSSPPNRSKAMPLETYLENRRRGSP